MDHLNYHKVFAIAIAISLKQKSPMYSTIMAEMIIKPRLIDINHETMLLNIGCRGFTGCPLKYLFEPNDKCYCSNGDTKNCVDLLIDLKCEYTFTKFIAWTAPSGFNCFLVKHIYGYLVLKHPNHWIISKDYVKRNYIHTERIILMN